MKRIVFSLSLLATISLSVSCNRNDDLNPTPNDLLSGYMLSARDLDIDSPATKYTEYAKALFFKHPGDTALHMAVDSVKVNGNLLTLDNNTKVYSGAGSFLMDNNCNWDVSGSSNIASFRYNYNTPYPAYIDAMPDTIDHLSGTTVTLPLGIDSATMSVSANLFVMGTYRGASGFLSPEQMATINVGPAILQVSGYKTTKQAFGGKNFLFIKKTTKTKTVWVK